MTQQLSTFLVLRLEYSWKNFVNTMGIDAWALSVTKSLTTMVLPKQENMGPCFQEERFQITGAT